MNKDSARKLLETYGRAWVTQDPDLILTVFTPDATYDDPHEPKNHGHAAIRSYWMNKVIGEQKDISFNLVNTWIDEGGGSQSSPSGMRNLRIPREISGSKCAKSLSSRSRMGSSLHFGNIIRRSKRLYSSKHIF